MDGSCDVHIDLLAALCALFLLEVPSCPGDSRLRFALGLRGHSYWADIVLVRHNTAHIHGVT